MELIQDKNSNLSTATETSAGNVKDQHNIDEGINQISQQFWQELNDTSSSDFRLWGMWK